MSNTLRYPRDGYSRDYIIIKAIQHGYNPRYTSTNTHAKSVPPEMTKNVQYINLPRPREVPKNIQIQPKPIAPITRKKVKPARKEVIDLENFQIVKRKTRPFSIGAVASIMIGAIVLSTLVYTGSLVNQEVKRCNELSETMEVLCAENKALERELAEKNDLTVIEDIAKNELGMISMSQAKQKYVPIEGQNSVIVHKTEEQTTGFGPTLLNSFSEIILNFLEILE